MCFHSGRAVTALEQLQGIPQRLSLLHIKIEGFGSDRQAAPDSCSSPRKKSAISQKCKHIDETVSNRCEQRLSFTMHKVLLTILSVEIQYMFSKAPTGQTQLLGNLLSNAIQMSHY